MEPQQEYYAFISYKECDYKWAKWLQHKLEHYRLPVSVRREHPYLPQKIKPVFEYKSEMAGGELAPTIRKALGGSKYLIVICSPETPKSPWVASEVQNFIESGRKDRIIPFVIDGEAYAKDPSDECFPKPLLDLEEPLRGISINEMGKEAAAIKVVAQMFGLKFDTLWQRYEREKRKKRFATIGATMAFALAVSASAVWMWEKNNELMAANIQIENQRKELSDKNEQLEKTNKKLQAAYDSIETQKNELQNANNDLKESRDKISLQNNQINEQNTRLEQTNTALNIKSDSLKTANNNLLAANEEIKKTNRNLEIEKKNVKDALWRMMKNQARAVAEKANQLIDDGDSYTAQKILLEVLPSENNPDRPYIPEAEAALRKAKEKESFILRNENSSFESIAISGNDQNVCVVTYNNEILAWNKHDGLKLLHTATKRGFNTYLSFCSDKNYIVNQLSDTVFITDYTNKSIIQSYKTPYKLLTPFDNGTKCIALNKIKDNNYILNIIDVKNGQIENTFDGLFDYFPNSISLDKKENLVTTSSWTDDTIRVWNLESCELVAKWKAHEQGVEFVNMSQDGNKIISSEREVINIKLFPINPNTDNTINKNRIIKIWESKSGRIINEIPCSCNSAIFSPDGQYIFAYDDNYIKVLKQDNGEIINIVEIVQGKIKSILFSNDNNSLIIMTGNGFIRYMELSSLFPNNNPEHNTIIRPMAVSPSAHEMLVSTGDSILCIDINDYTIKDWFGYEYSLPISSIKYSKDGAKIYTTQEPLTLSWDSNNHSLLEEFNLSLTQYANCIDFSPYNNYVVLGCKDGIIRFYDSSHILSRESIPQKLLCGHKGEINSIQISPDGKRMITASDDSTIKVWDMATDSCIKTINEHKFKVNSVLYSPNGKYFVSASSDKTIKIWDSDSFECLNTIVNPDGEVLYVVFDSIGNRFASASTGHTIKIWDAKTAVMLQKIDGVYSSSCEFTLDGSSIIYYNGYGNICLKKIPKMEDLLQELSSKFEKNPLTPEERRQFYLGE